MVLTLLPLFLLSCSVTETPPDLEWRNGWVRALPPGSGMTAAYGELHNNSDHVIGLDTFDSDAFAIVELHLSIMEDGVSRMREQQGVQIAPGESLQLLPGGLHLMLMKPRTDPAPGSVVQITITSDGNRFNFNLPVESR